MSWLAYALMTVVCWGLYGVALHTGQIGMEDPVHGRYKAFLFVGIAYFLIAVLAPAALLQTSGATWDFPTRGAAWSLGAGAVGAIGAFCVLLAFGARGQPAVVMTLVFSLAPVVNAITVILKEGLWSEIRWPFVLGIVLASVGGGLVTTYKPTKAHAAPAVPSPPDATPAD